MMNSKHLSPAFKILLSILIVLLAFFFLFPTVWLVLTAFKPQQDVYAMPARILPSHLTLDNFRRAMELGDFVTFFRNTVFTTVLTVIGMILINTTSGYALAKFRFFGSGVLNVFFLALVMIPMETLMISLFQVIKSVGLYNSLWGIIIPLSASPVGNLIMRQYFLTLPDEMLEAARIDGASEYYILWKIAFPLGKPAIAVLTVFGFMWRWNEYIFPLIVISKPELYTLQLAISIFMTNPNILWGELIAMVTISIVPVVIVFLIFQRKFMGGLSAGSVKE